MLAMNVAAGVDQAVYGDPRVTIAEFILAIVAVLIIWLAFNGRVGVFLGASIAPGGMIEH